MEQRKRGSATEVAQAAEGGRGKVGDRIAEGKRTKKREQDELNWQKQQKIFEAKRKEEEEMAILKQNRLSFSSLPIKETKIVSFEKIMLGSELQQSLQETQRQLDKDERKQNRVYLTFTLSGIPERSGQLERSDGWFYSDELLIFRAKTWEIPEPKIATIDRIIIRALPENLFRRVAVSYHWFGVYELFPKKTMSVQTEEKKTMSIQTQTEVEDAIQEETKSLMEEVIAEQIKEILEDVIKAEEEEKRRRAREEEEKAKRDAELEALRKKLEEEERQRKMAEDRLRREEEAMRANLKEKEREMREREEKLKRDAEERRKREEEEKRKREEAERLRLEQERLRAEEEARLKKQREMEEEGGSRKIEIGTGEIESR